MAEAMMLSAIESLDCWLLKKGGILEENLEKLYSLIVGMTRLGEEKKDMVHSLLLQFGTEEERNNLLHLNKDKVYNLLHLNKKKMRRLVVGMADYWEDNKERLYSLLFRVAEGDDESELDSVVVEIVDLWEDGQGELNKKELHNLLFEMQNMNNHSKKKMQKQPNYSKKKMHREMLFRVAELWKDKQPKLNKGKLYTWLANKVDLHEPKFLFREVLDIILEVSSDFHEAVKEAKRELGEIQDLITHKKLGEGNSLRYFISDVVEMAHKARFLIQLEDSDPFTLFYELSVLQGFEIQPYREWVGKKFAHIVNALREIKVSILGLKVERLHNVREMEGGENVVGLEEDVKSLLYGEGNSKITVITGMAGSGKTTLARQVYNHKTITQQFERRAWVCLSKVYSRKEMLVSLIRQMVDSSQLETIERADYKSLKQMLRQQLMGTRYFIVFDDVSYKTTHLEYVKKALPKAKQKSRLLLTTRSVSRDNYSEVNHHMKSMDDEKSWKLLLKTLSIEGSHEEFPKPLVKKARQILRKCGGLPLAIKEVGRNWAKKRLSGSEWEEVIESIDLSETLGALESAYRDWDPQLQSCFLHLAFFKEGVPIRTKRLIQIWVVMGVVTRSEELYQHNLKELSRESIIGIDMDIKGNIKTCYVHVVYHMLSIRKAEDELNFEILRKDGNSRPSHHRAIYCSREKLMNYSSNQDNHLVSLFFYGGGYFNVSPSYWKHFEQLKTLDMEDFGLKILPDVIGMLSDLRYLGLRNNYIKELPYSLSRLKRLEVLDIALNFMVGVEDIIWEIESLRHLYMSDVSCQKTLRIDTLKNLETWTYVSVHNWEYEVSRLEMMTSLTKLGIQQVDGSTDISKLFSSLSELTNLEFLILRGFRFKSMPSLDEIGILRNLRELKLDGLITELPSANNFPPDITHVVLVNSCLHKDPIPILEKLLGLRYLKLQNAYTGQQMVISRNGFLELEFLVIEELWHLTNVQIEEGAMKWLEELEIKSCPNLATLPEDYCPRNMMMFKMKTTKKNATKIRESSFVSKIRECDIQP